MSILVPDLCREIRETIAEDHSIANTDGVEQQANTAVVRPLAGTALENESGLRRSPTRKMTGR